jgi:hypothetical protein
VLGKFTAAGTLPLCLDRLRAYGIHLPTAIFAGEQVLKER